jgi:hypothetical protein
MVKSPNGYTINLNYLLVNEDINDVSIVAAHEYIIDGERSTLGAVAISLGESSNNDGISIFIPILIIILISAIILFKDRSL